MDLGDDDRTDGCVEHLWRFRAVDFRDSGSWSEYECERCEGLLLVPPGGSHPETV